MQKSGAPVTRDIVLIKGDKMFLDNFCRKKSRQGLRRGWLHIFVARNPLLSMMFCQKIYRVKIEAFVECIREVYVW